MDRLVDKFFFDFGKGFVLVVVVFVFCSFVVFVIEYINIFNVLLWEDELGSGGGFVKSLVVFVSSVEGRLVMMECI